MVDEMVDRLPHDWPARECENDALAVLQ
jgi:hypothetical protein